MSKKKILHLIQQEKITEQIVDNFSQVEVDNYFLIFDKSQISLHFKGEKTLIDHLEINSVIKKYNIHALIVHGLFPVFTKIINEIHDDLSLAWFAWGFDVYNQPAVKHLLYEKETNNYLINSRTWKDILKTSSLVRLISFYLLNRDDPYKLVSKAQKKIKYFCSYIEEDYIFYKFHFNTNSSFLYAPFCTIEQYLAGNDNLEIDANASNILIGNSNSAENNHVDVFKSLSSMSIKKGTCLVPLSYGYDQKYKEYVIKSGVNYLGDKFVPLLDFMDRRSYLDMLTTCSTAVFYHNRQQAMGNIIALLYMGVRIYLSENNPVFHYCNRVGLHVFDFEKDFNVFKNSKLDKDLVEANRKVLRKLFNEKEVQMNLTNLILAL